jgi:nucleotidyltransferase substrate binding protein (TIGR01987 family)
MEESGVTLSLTLPRNVIKEAFAAGLLQDGHVWIDMMDHRNKLSHTYNEVVFAKAVEAIASRYLPAIQALHSDLQKKFQA